MSSSRPIPPQQPRIRSSCDGCGIVKMKCDQRHPECGRCIAHGISCVYGISRKIGKPHRNSPLTDDSGGSSRTSTCISTSTGTTSTSTSTGTSLSDPFMSYTWDLVDNNLNNDDNDYDSDNDENGRGAMFSLDGFPDDSLAGTSQTDLHSIAFGEWMVAEQFESTLAATIPHFLSSDAGAKLDLPGNWEGLLSPGIGQGSTESGKDHACHREAHELLGTSLFTNSGWTGNLVVSSPLVLRGALPLGGGDGEMALDHLLHLNRKACERLASLLACSCAGSPYLMILYASLISAILTRYQHAASGEPSTSSSVWNPLFREDTFSSADGFSQAMLKSRPMVAPSRISIGDFSVDDPKVQSALNIQLLAGELKRVAGLIDQIAFYGIDHQAAEGQNRGTDTNRLYQSLAMWLRGEHSRVTDVIRNRLRELDG